MSLFGRTTVVNQTLLGETPAKQNCSKYPIYGDGHIY